MREMKDSGIAWIGEIPREWEVCPIKRNFAIYAGATPKSDNPTFWDGDIAWITPADYKTEDRTIKKGRRSLTQEGFESCATYLLPVNSVIFSKRAPIGLVVINEETLCTNQGCLGCVPYDKADSVFFYYTMSAFTEQYELYGSGTTFKEISATDFANFELPVPPLSEQRLIANFLDEKCGEIDELVALQEKMIEELKAYKQSVITETVTKGLNPNVKMKDSGVDWIGEIPEHWSTQRLRTLGWTQNGISKGGEYFGEDFEFPFVSYPDAYKNFVVPYPTGRANSSESDRETYSLEEGDVLFTRTSETIEEIGFASTCINTIPNAIYSGFLIRFRPTTDALYKGFSKYYFRGQMLRGYFVKQMNIVTRASLSQDLLKSLTVVLPPLSEQHQIATYLDEKCSEIDSLISIKQKKIEELKDYKKSLIYEYVTGKKQVG